MPRIRHARYRLRVLHPRRTLTDRGTKSTAFEQGDLVPANVFGASQRVINDAVAAGITCTHEALLDTSAPLQPGVLVRIEDVRDRGEWRVAQPAEVRSWSVGACREFSRHQHALLTELRKEAS